MRQSLGMIFIGVAVGIGQSNRSRSPIAILVAAAMLACYALRYE